MVRKLSFAALATGAWLMTSPALAAGSPLVGTWATVADTGTGKIEATMTVAEAGDSYTVAIEDKPQTGPDGQAGPAAASTVSDVKVDGANFSFKRTIDFQGQKIELAYTGTVNGNALTAQANSEFGASAVTGTRQ